MLEFQDVRRSFTARGGVFGRTRGEVHAVAGVSLTVRRGETLGLVGESGCGKSTLGRMAVGLLAPTAGRVLFQGLPVTAPGAGGNSGRGRLQMVFQDPFSSLNPRMRVGAAIGEPLLAEALSRTEREARVAAMLERVGLAPEHARRYPHEFSGGQRQRVAIARALVTRPDLVVCDEAVSALDASVQAQVLNLLKDAQESFGLTYLFISHDLGVVGHMSDRVAVMYLGHIVELAPRAALFREPAHPYTQALLTAAPSMHGRRLAASDPSDLAAPGILSGEPPSPFAPPKGCAFHPRCPQAMPQCRMAPAPAVRDIAPGHQVACHLYEPR